MQSVASCVLLGKLFGCHNNKIKFNKKKHFPLNMQQKYEEKSVCYGCIVKSSRV